MRVFTFNESRGFFLCEQQRRCRNRALAKILTDEENAALPPTNQTNFIFQNKVGAFACSECLKKQRA